jgi:biopolymer transport protein ExbB
METALQRYVLNGGVMMVFLVPLALLAVAFVVQGFINLRRARLCPGSFNRRLPDLLAGCQTRRQIEALLEREGHSLALVLRRVLRHLEFKADADPAEVLAESIEEECNALQQRNSQLALVYNVAPLMGLLGTVFGMLRTFRNFAESTDPSVRELSVGINVALLTTAWGLAIAIPAFIFLYIFTRRISACEQVLFPAEGARALETILRHIGLQPASDAGQAAPDASQTPD